MDVTRSSIRLGADKVTCVYRRRQEDMTALPEEVEGAVAEPIVRLHHAANRVFFGYQTQIFHIYIAVTVFVVPYGLQGTSIPAVQTPNRSGRNSLTNLQT